MRGRHPLAIGYGGQSGTAFGGKRRRQLRVWGVRTLATAIGKVWAGLKRLLGQNPAAAVFGALLTAAALYAVVTFVVWMAYRIPGLPGVVADLAKSIGVSTPQLLEFNAIVVTAVFIAVQLWVTHRRAGAAEATALAAMRTAESTVKSNAAQQFKDAVELLDSPSEIAQLGGVLALTFIAKDYPEYQDAVSVILDALAQQEGG